MFIHIALLSEIITLDI